MLTCGEYSSDDEEVEHNGTILSKIGLSYEQIQYDVSFDITIELISGTKYIANMSASLPTGNILTDGTSSYEKTDFTDVIFKRS